LYQLFLSDYNNYVVRLEKIASLVFDKLEGRMCIFPKLPWICQKIICGKYNAHKYFDILLVIVNC